jgi:hypothetical protein
MITRSISARVHKSDMRSMATARSSRPTTNAALLAAAMLALPSMCVHAQEQEQLPPSQAEFLDLLEYLGSWDGPDGDWVQFLGDSGDLAWELLDIESDQPTQEAAPDGT